MRKDYGESFFVRFGRPFAIGLLLATSGLAWGSFVKTVDYGAPGIILMLFGLVTILLIATGLPLNSERLIDYGIMFGAATWMSTFVTHTIHGGPIVFGAISLGWAVACGGVWLAEVNDE